MNNVLSLQQTSTRKTGASPDSIFSLVSVAGCGWTTLMPYSTASVVFC